MTPYIVLGIDETVDDQKVREAYLQLLKQNPPDRNPEKFKEINQAYETINTKEKRLEYYLFSTDVPINTPFEALPLHMKVTGKRTPPSFENLKKALRNER